MSHRAFALLAMSSDEPSSCSPRLHQTSHQAITLLAVSSPDEPSSHRPAWTVTSRMEIHNLSRVSSTIDLTP
ncbi:hypothetical protein EOD39_13643 [Acipenser ruthenus]|uniref:Uncharacterized protein n=1 Tax=Acipenser ruthenus TaxID=7906 RepID=A0A662YMZ2_ACIRT|nr:hypothetical protein EOD39_13643 [Acipenser ruthenus]